MLYSFLLSKNANQPKLCIYYLPLEPSCPAPMPSLKIIIEHQAGHLVLYSNFSPTTYFTPASVYTSMLFSPSLPLFPSPTMSTNSFSMSMSPFLPCKQVRQYHFFVQIPLCINILYLFYSFCITSLCITSSRFIHVSRTDSNSFFLWLSHIPLYICNTFSLSIHLLMDIQVASMSQLL